MSGLAAIQREFLAALLAPGPGADARMEVYRRSVHDNLRGALAAAYPVVLRLVGETFFREAARRYARAVPSTSGDLNEYGAGFAAFLAGYPHASALEYLPDVARLEWALHESHHAADGGAPDLVALAGVDPRLQGEIRLRLDPAVRLIASPLPVLAIWEANQPGRDGTPARDAGPDRVLVRRDASGTAAVALSIDDWVFLSACERGATLDEACADLGDAAADYLVAALARHARDGVVCGFDAPAGA
jgi:hypothetical protein